MITDWLVQQLEQRSDRARLIVTDPLNLVTYNEPRLRAFADRHGFLMVAASTNLVFRELLAAARDDPGRTRLLVVDKTPFHRRSFGRHDRAPPLFYPDLLNGTKPEDRVDLSLVTYLNSITGDRGWPMIVDTPEYARVIAEHLDEVIVAHHNLRQIDPVRFTDDDLKQIVTAAALGMGSSAFGSADPVGNWQIGLLHHTEFTELGRLAPEAMETMKKRLARAPRPFNWFADHDPEDVVRGFYLGLILSQHDPNWELLLTRIDPGLRFFSGVAAEDLHRYAPEIIAAAPDVADRDCTRSEDAIDVDILREIAFERLSIASPDGFFKLLEQEEYSTLFRSLALLSALRDLLGETPDLERHARLCALLRSPDPETFVEQRAGEKWPSLVQAYLASEELVRLERMLISVQKDLKVANITKLDFPWFWKLWVDAGLCRVENALSTAERFIYMRADRLLPRAPDQLPPEVTQALEACRAAIDERRSSVTSGLETVNRAFQQVAWRQFRVWRKGETEPVLTSQYIDRVLAPHWDPETEQAAIIVLDGIRFDVWSTYARPLFLATMDPITRVLGCSQLPSETEISRKAIAAGLEPAAFSSREAENVLLAKALTKLLHRQIVVTKEEDEGLAVGQTVRYRSSDNRLSMVIFSYFDTELHHILTKEVGDVVRPSKPLKDLYDQFQRFIEEDVMDVVRQLPEGCKVFVVADHGAGPVGTKKIEFKPDDLGKETDCAFLHCALTKKLDETRIPSRFREQIIEFTPDEIGMPREVVETTGGRNPVQVKRDFKAYIFPAPGYAFSRPNSRPRLPAWSHGGCSLQEMIVPMEVFIMQPKMKEPIAASFEPLATDPYEGEEIDVSIRFWRSGAGKIDGGELRVSLEAFLNDTPIRASTPVVYLQPWDSRTITIRFTPDLANVTKEERSDGTSSIRIGVRYTYQDSTRTIRRTLNQEIRVRLNPDRIVRRVGSLGSILGLTPKGSIQGLRLE